MLAHRRGAAHHRHVDRRRLAACVALASGAGAGALLGVGVVALLRRRPPRVLLGSAAALATAIAAGRYALRQRVARPRARRPQRPFLFCNPKSGGGKAARYRLAEEARARGIEAIELAPGSDLAGLARQAVDAGADALAMAGGDGSQAILAAIAAERGLPYACIPSGTRNHFALDLGVDRDDVVGALEALVLDTKPSTTEAWAAFDAFLARYGGEEKAVINTAHRIHRQVADLLAALDAYQMASRRVAERDQKVRDARTASDTDGIRS